MPINLSGINGVDSSGNIVTNGAVNAAGNITGNYFIGNGSQLTGIAASGNVNLTSVTTNVIPASNITLSLGNATNQWKDLWVSNSTIYMNSIPLTIANNTLLVDGIPVVTSGPNSAPATGNISTDQYFIGNGAFLTGLPATYANSNAAAFLANFGSNSISTTGTIIAGNTVIDGALIVTGNANVQGNLTYNNITNLTTDNLVLGLGNSQTGINVTGAGIVVGNTNEASFLYNFSSRSWVSNISISSAGNVTANYLIGNGSLLTNLPIQPGTYGNANVETYLPTSATILGMKANTTATNSNVANNKSNITILQGQVYANANVNSYLNSNSNVVIRTTGNVTAPYFIGNGSLLTNLPAGNYSNANVEAYLPTSNIIIGINSNVSNTNNNVSTTNSSVANLSTALGSTNSNVSDTNSNVANLSISLANTNSNVSNNTSNITTLQGQVYANANAQAYLASNANVTISTTGNIKTYANISGAYILGNGSQLTGLPIQSGTYSNANVSNYLASNSNVIIATTGNITGGNLISNQDIFATGVLTLAQSFIDPAAVTMRIFADGDTSYIQTGNGTAGSTGNVAFAPYYDGTGRVVINTGSGNINAGNVIASGFISATGNVNAGGMLINGNVVITGNANVQGNLTYNNLTNITTSNLVLGLGNNQTGVNVTGAGIAVGNTNQATILYNFAANSWVSNISFSAVGNVSGGNLSGTLIAGTLSTAAQPNITSVGTLTSLNSGVISSSGNVTGGNILTAGLISATGNVNASYVNATGLANGNTSITIPTSGNNIVLQQGGVLVGRITNDTIAIGADAGNTGQISLAVAIGVNAGAANQGYQSVALGYLAGGNSQSSQAIAIGGAAGADSQGATAIAIGTEAASSGQGQAAVAIGYNAGHYGQGLGAVTIGAYAGFYPPGDNSIAIGAYAGGYDSGAAQANNSIILNASGGYLQGVQSGLYINPIRNVANIGNILTYNAATSEVVYSNTISITGNVTGGNVVTVGLISATGNITGGNVTTAGLISATGNVTANYFKGNGSQLTGIVGKTSGSWNLAPGPNTVSITVAPGNSYSMWVNGNIPNGIVMWNATVTVSNTNVPVVGVQYGYYYAAGGALVLTAIPNQIIGQANQIDTSVRSTTTSNVFTFGITNNSGSYQVVNWGYTTL
jgi:trimeric autotransporter adhesin